MEHGHLWPSYEMSLAENWNRMAEDRYLIVTADDFGIGPATTRGILELVDAGVVTASVLLVNSPHAEASVRAWRASGRRFELGWHPCLTIDRPVSPKEKVPSLVDAEGRFLPLAKLMRKLIVGGVRRGEVEDEFRAQYERFREMTQSEPPVVNTHHHIQVFGLIGASLRAVLERQSPRPYVRRIRESWRTLAGISGGRLKRLFLNQLGRSESRRLAAAGYPGNDWLGGITDPLCVKDSEFFRRWLRATPGKFVELTCHPGHLDSSLVGRDGSFEDGQIHRRPREWELLKAPSFKQAVRDAGFSLIRPTQMCEIRDRAERVAVPA
jgi:chitin disaccharide deacetylase